MKVGRSDGAPKRNPWSTSTKTPPSALLRAKRKKEARTPWTKVAYWSHVYELLLHTVSEVPPKAPPQKGRTLGTQASRSCL